MHPCTMYATSKLQHETGGVTAVTPSVGLNRSTCFSILDALGGSTRRNARYTWSSKTFLNLFGSYSDILVPHHGPVNSIISDQTHTLAQYNLWIILQFYMSIKQA